MSLRDIFDTLAETHHAPVQDPDGTITKRTPNSVELEYGILHYKNGEKGETIRANNGLDSSVYINNGRMIVQISQEASMMYMRRWLVRESPVKPALQRDGTICEVLALGEDEITKFLLATYCDPDQHY